MDFSLTASVLTSTGILALVSVAMIVAFFSGSVTISARTESRFGATIRHLVLHGTSQRVFGENEKFQSHILHADQNAASFIF